MKIREAFLTAVESCGERIAHGGFFLTCVLLLRLKVVERKIEIILIDGYLYELLFKLLLEVFDTDRLLGAVPI